MNAKAELLVMLRHTGKKPEDIKCAQIDHSIGYGNEHFEYSLNVNHTQEELNAFLNSLDFNYDNGYGLQEIAGTIWFENDWFERAEYDGSEWWEYNRYPGIPNTLL